MIRSISIQDEEVVKFQECGFHIVPTCTFEHTTQVEDCIGQLECILRGEYGTDRPPASTSKAPPQYMDNHGRFAFDNTPPPFTGGKVKTIHAINIWMASPLFGSIVTAPSIGAAVTRLMGWEEYGCRLVQDQAWIKPPHSGPLSFHRDTPYIDFSPSEVCTVWIPFDDTRIPDIGTLEYCASSHRWQCGRRGSANQFYNADYTKLLLSAAQQHFGQDALTVDLLDIVKVLGEAGCCSFHNGSVWHGSGPNKTDRWRRGVGVHYVRGDAELQSDPGKLWKSLLEGSTFDQVFPLVCQPI